MADPLTDAQLKLLNVSPEAFDDWSAQHPWVPQKADMLHTLSGGLLGTPDTKTMDIAAPKRFPGADELHAARENDQAYGTDMGSFFQPGADIRKIDLQHAPEMVNNGIFGNVPWDKVDKPTADRLYVGAIAANRSAIASLGFNPRHMVLSPPKPADLSASGAYMPDADTMWIDEKYPSTFVHESIHRGIEKLRESGDLAKTAKEATADKPYISDTMEEMFVRSTMLKHFGGVEKGRGDLGDKQIAEAEGYGKVNDRWLALLDQVEAIAAQRIQKNRPMGPR